MFFFNHNAQNRVNAVSPLDLRVSKDKAVVRAFDAAVYQRFLSEGDPVLTTCIVNRDLLRGAKQDVFSRVDNLAALCVNLVEVAVRSGIKFEEIAWLALIAAKLLSGKYNLLRSFIQFGISERDLPRIL